MEYHNLKAEVAFVVCFKVQTLGLFWSIKYLPFPYMMFTFIGMGIKFPLLWKALLL